LPIEMIVIVAVAVLVLVVISAFFVGGFGSSTQMTLEQAFQSACNNLRTVKNCDKNEIPNIQVKVQFPGEAEPGFHTLAELCMKKGVPNSFNFAIECAKACGCPY